MYLSASFLSMKENRIAELDKTNIDYLHVDVIDGEFVPFKSLENEKIKSMVAGANKPLDVHLMVKDVKKYVDYYAALKPYMITFHYEALKDSLEMINYIKDKGIKVGIAINPMTSADSILSYLDLIDYVLVMGVFPGRGGQEMITNTFNKINRLKFIREINKFDFKIGVDGGVNGKTINFVKNADILVVGSYITSASNYEQIVNDIKASFSC